MSDEFANLSGDRSPEIAGSSTSDSPVEADLSNTTTSLSSLTRWVAWGAVSIAFVVFVVLGGVHTYLGVKVKPTVVTIGSFQTERLDMNGHEHVWRIWWRARHEMMNLGSGWGFPVLLTTLGLLFIVLSIFSIWVALVPHDESENDLIIVGQDPPRIQ